MPNGSRRASTSGKHPRRWLTVPRAVAAALIAPLLAWAVPTYVPRIIDRVSGKDPVSIILDTNPHQGFADEVVLPPNEWVRGNPGPGGCARFHSWADQLGAVPAARTEFRLFVKGRADDPVVLDEIRPRILSRKPRLHGTPVKCPADGETPIRGILIRLDDPVPRARFVDEELRQKPIAFTLAKNETATFDVSASSVRCFCRWVLDLRFVVGGSTRILTVTNHGQPFETTAQDGANASVARFASTNRNTPTGVPPRYDWSWQDGTWLRVDQERKRPVDVGKGPLPPLDH